MSEFHIPVDIANRGLQHCGAARIDRVKGFAEISRNAAEVSFCYGKLRVAELQTNVWTFAVRYAALRAVDATTMMLAPALWVQGTTYFRGSIVADQTGNLWISKIPDNLGSDPLASLTWEPYFGPLTVARYASSTGYLAGELVYTAAGDGSSRTFLSLQSNNTDNPATATAYDATVTYSKNQVVTYLSVAYMSLADLNTGNTPSTSPTLWTSIFVGGNGSVKWLQIGGAEFPMGVGLATLDIVYPLGAGPSSQSGSRNIFRLPAGYLREAPQNPKGAAISYLGGPSGLTYNDWRFDGDWLVTSDTGPIVLRFVADLTDVGRMNPMFCEAFAARVGLAVCEPLTQSTAKVGVIAKEYSKWIADAKTRNAIEQGYDEPPDDDYISCRS